LNGLITQDLAPRKVGDAAYGLIVGKTGKIQAEAYVLLAVEALFVAIPDAEKAPALVEMLDRYLVMEDAELSLAEPSPTWMLGFGPRAADVVVAARRIGARGGMTLRGGLPTAVLSFDETLSAEIVAAAAAEASPSLVASDEGWERVRVEHGIPERGPDWGDECYPQEASLELDGVSFSKGCYLGQEAVFMLEKRGHVKRRLVQLAVEGDVAVGDALKDAAGTVIGSVTSRVLRGGKGLALGYVKYKYAKSETVLTVGEGGRGVVTDRLAVKAE